MMPMFGPRTHQIYLQVVIFLLEDCIIFSFSTSFLRNCGRGESLWTTTHCESIVGGKQGYAVCKILLFHQMLISVSIKFHGDDKTGTKFEVNLATFGFGILLDLKQWCLSVCHALAYRQPDEMCLLKTQ